MVTEQVLNLASEEKTALRDALGENLRPENAVYRYNYFYNNCTTKARDIIEQCISGKIEYAEREDFAPSYRDMVHEMTRNNPWSRFGNDLLLGIKEVDIDALLPKRHYVFFGHLAKKQAYNRSLLQAMMRRRITFSDYEYMVDEAGARVCAFGWWAGIVGVYYTLRGYGLQTGAFSLPEPDRQFTLAQLRRNLRAIELPKVKLLVTGGGRVATGARSVLEEIGAEFLPITEYLDWPSVDRLTFTMADADALVRPITAGKRFSFAHFKQHPELYTSNFARFARATDILVCGHFWSPGEPVYLRAEDFRAPGFRIRMIGDITCDIMGSIHSTLRASTHAAPYYDYNPVTGLEEPPFSSENNVTVMAVDTCPNALPRDTSAYFGELLCTHVLAPLLRGEPSPVLDRATILQDGGLTSRFDYLAGFVEDI